MSGNFRSLCLWQYGLCVNIFLENLYTNLRFLFPFGTMQPFLQRFFFVLYIFILFVKFFEILEKFLSNGSILTNLEGK